MRAWLHHRLTCIRSGNRTVIEGITSAGALAGVKKTAGNDKKARNATLNKCRNEWLRTGHVKAVCKNLRNCHLFSDSYFLEPIHDPIHEL